MPRLIVSTVGTSLLSNVARGKGRETEILLRDTANLKDNQIEEDQKAVILQLAREALKKLESSSPHEA